jgi:lauroyl/myristoyl acyltransferase
MRATRGPAARKRRVTDPDKPRHRPKHVAEYVLIRAASVLFARTPYRFALGCGWVLAWFGHHVMRYRVRTAKSRIREVFKDRAEREIRRIAWLSWRDFLFNAVDMYRLRLIDGPWIERHVIGHEQVKETLHAHCATGRGAVIASPHMGASELASVVMQRLDVPVFQVTGRQKNPLTDAYINRLRESTGIPKVQKGSSVLRSVIRRLKQGGCLTFLADLRVEHHGIPVEFLGKQASVAPGMASFALQARVPIIPVIVTRVGWTRHRLRFHEPIRPDPDRDKREDLRRMTQEVFHIMTRAVRDCPEQWFWYNKSWILDPVEDSARNRTADEGKVLR